MRDGHRVFDFSISPLLEAEGVLVISRDITDRATANARVRGHRLKVAKTGLTED